MSNKKLKPEVAEKYEVVGGLIHAHFPHWNEVDMSQLNLIAADSLVSQGFPYLKVKETKVTKKK